MLQTNERTRTTALVQSSDTNTKELYSWKPVKAKRSFFRFLSCEPLSFFSTVETFPEEKCKNNSCLTWNAEENTKFLKVTSFTTFSSPICVCMNAIFSFPPEPKLETRGERNADSPETQKNLICTQLNSSFLQIVILPKISPNCIFRATGQRPCSEGNARLTSCSRFYRQLWPVVDPGVWTSLTHHFAKTERGGTLILIQASHGDLHLSLSGYTGRMVFRCLQTNWLDKKTSNLLLGPT